MRDGNEGKQAVLRLVLGMSERVEVYAQAVPKEREVFVGWNVW